MRVVVSGVTGLIGRRLAPHLAEAGHEVVGLSRDCLAARRKVPDLHDAYDWHWRGQKDEPQHEALDGADVVIHLAGEPVAGRWTAAKRRKIEESRVRGTRALVEAFGHADAPPRVLLAASAIGYYGPTGDQPVTEASPSGGDFLARVCSRWEDEAIRAEELAVRVVRLRFGLVLGLDGGVLAEMLPVFRLGLGGPLGSGAQWWSWVHEDDVTRMVDFALENDELRGPVNVTSPLPVRQRDFAETLGKVLHRPARLPVPRAALRLGLGSFASEVLTSRRVMPEVAREAGFGFAYADLESALRHLLDRPS